MSISPIASRSRSLNDVLSAEIRSMLARTGGQQADLSKLLRIAQPQVSKRLRGLIPWSVPELELVADHFGLDPVDFIARAVQNETPHRVSGTGSARVRRPQPWYTSRDSNPEPAD